MSRSIRHTPLISITCRGFKLGEQDDKTFASRSVRRAVRMLLSRYEEVEVWPLSREMHDRWYWAKDGYQWIEPTSKWMRK